METRAYAKINLSLEVLGLRPDGYHEVRTVLQTIGLADRLHFASAPALQFECSDPQLEGEDNLVWKAAESLRAATGCGRGANMRLEKRVPIGMGLGGGSSDAAATLAALNGLWGLALGDQQLRSIAAVLGSDVPFFLGNGTALGEGRGEIAVDLPSLPRQWIVVLCPALRWTPLATQTGATTSRKTATLYSMLTAEDYSDGNRTLRLVDTLQDIDLPGSFPKASPFPDDLLYNTFERVAPLAYLGFDEVRRDFLQAGAARVHLSGTGPALYALVSNKEDGEGIVRSLKGWGRRAYCVNTNESGV